MTGTRETPLLRAATDADIDLLVGWHADPEISRYWDGETFTAEEIRARLRRERVDAWIIEMRFAAREPGSAFEPDS